MDFVRSLFHDENKNLKLDKNWRGIPKEGRGFSNNPAILGSSSSFDKEKFMFVKRQEGLHIYIKY
jgi:uncharacterized protein (DUF2141 family)